MMYHYSITRTLDDDEAHSAYFSVSNYDPVNCAHMIAAGFNTMSRNFTLGWVLGVVHPETGEVQYDGKIEEIKRDKPEPSAFAHIARDVLEDAYDEYLLVREMLSESGVETIPISAGVDELRGQVAELTKRNNHEFHARSMYEQVEGQKREAARAELIEHVKAAYVQWGQDDPGRQREGLKSHLRGMIEVLSKYLVAIGEADADERHAVTLRVCEIPEGNYLYGDD